MSELDFRVPAFIRGELVDDGEMVTFGARGHGLFEAPALVPIIDRIPLRSPADLGDLQSTPLTEIVDLLVELGQTLQLDTNTYVQEAMEAARVASAYPDSMLRNSYAALPFSFGRAELWDLIDSRIGRDVLEGWVERVTPHGRRLRVRAFGARSLHIPAGNGALIAAITIVRSAITRSDAIIKAPSNDPLTAIAIARTLADIAPDHPLTRHICVAYWKGGDRRIEDELYQPGRVEKIVAWGGVSSLKNVARYIQPGLELIALDPKRSSTIIGEEAFADDATVTDVATRIALDAGMANQEACASARTVFVQSGTDAAGVDRLERLGEQVYEALRALPGHISTEARRFDSELRDHVDASRLLDDWFRVIGVEANEGGVIVSRLPEPVDYAPQLSGRVVNLVPVDEPEEVLRWITSYTQTVGIYPDSLKTRLRDILPLYGAQRLTSLGYACHVDPAMPQDAIEPLRRMCKWIVDDHCDPDVLPLLHTLPPVEELAAP